ncbi:hypothetical protein EYB53_024835 [Candidatus Chloroploca sp. M-50]|uniref:Uncharacterized protein n=1 Tax=Candidatus Chloroploca mongolica TaxID=2528176 RepID=A0ABS4DHQ0_9CHLR|nr:NAD(P)-dependent oxidoreductase [Candidatus Chloroploca mongolica]MBP1468958.1 hypothetical protein [Candidatus Chloroploca mongolica]
MLLVLHATLQHPAILRLIGWCNRRWMFLGSVFLVYAANEEYALTYASPRYYPLMRWSPWIAGVLRQNGRWALMLVVSSTERDFTNPASHRHLTALVEEVERLRRLVGAPQKTFAGILPGVLARTGILTDSPEAEVTLVAIVQAEQQVREATGYAADVPVIILGGRGFIGKRLVERFTSYGRNTYSVDVIDVASNPWPAHLTGQPAILINVTRKTALRAYIPHCWPALIILNEVYPEPEPEELAALTRIGAPVYHLVGVAGTAFPRFPKAYAGAIPCCAAQHHPKLRAVIRRLG